MTESAQTTDMPTTKHRFQVLDGWRGVCALLVALFHIDVLSSIYHLDLLRHAYLFVDFFFILSGFVISYSYMNALGSGQQIAGFMVKRFARLWPLHAVMLAILIAIECGRATMALNGQLVPLWAVFSGTRTVGEILPNILLLQYVGPDSHLTWNIPSWSISTEFWTYLVFAIAVFAAQKASSRIRVHVRIATVGVFAALVAAYAAYAHRGLNDTLDIGMFRCLFGFLVGHVAYLVWRLLSHVKVKSSLLEFAALALVILYVSKLCTLELPFATQAVFGFTVVVFAFEGGVISRLMRTPPLEWLGKRSYSIYMIHTLVIAFDHFFARVAEKVTHTVLMTPYPEGLTPDEPKTIITLGGFAQADLLTLFSIALLLVAADFSYNHIERRGQKAILKFANRRTLSSRAKPSLQDIPLGEATQKAIP